MSSIRMHPRRGLRTLVALGATGALLIGGASTAFAAPPETDSVCPAPSGNTDFPDVEGGQFEDVIECMGGYGIAGGFDDGEYKPVTDVTRGQMAKFIFNLVETGQPGTLNAEAPNNFDDVGDDGEFEDFISALHEAGIVDGTSADTYEPGADVTRGEMAKYIAEAINAATGTSVVDGDEPHAFDDVAEDGTFADFINALAAENIVQGDGAGNYNPSDNVNRGEMSLFIMRAAEYLENNGAWVPTQQSNQTYSVTPTQQLVTAEGEQRTYTADVGAAATVEVALAACDNVDITSGTVSFEATSGNADFGDTGSAEISEADGVALPANTTQTTVDTDGTFEFTLTSDDADCVLPVVFTDDAGNLPVDGDGLPTNDFGVGGDTQFANVDAMSLEPAQATNPYGSEHVATATLLNDGADDSADTADDVPVALDGETVQYRVVDTDGFAAITGCPSDGIRTLYDSAPADNIVAEGEVTTQDGVATISYTAEDPDAGSQGDSETHCILALWDGQAGSAYEGQATEASAQKDWNDEASTPADVTLSQQDDVNQFGENHTVTATVTDQFGDPVAGEDVTFTVDTDEFEVTRSTNDQGVATFTYQGPADPNPDTPGDTLEDDIDASTQDVPASEVENLTKTWTDSGS